MIGVLDYGMGNLRSVINALNFLEVKSTVIVQKHDFENITHLIIPGVGSFKQAMTNIIDRDLLNSIKKFNQEGNPILGICLGMQLLAKLGTEFGPSDGLGIIKGVVREIDNSELVVPHIGWNSIKVVNSHSVLAGVKHNVDFYFVHSYYFDVDSERDVIAKTEYGQDFPAIVKNEKMNAVGIQFHPEKSQKQGLKILKNFIKMSNA
tara:strand:- start:50 stop:667 length:618 start_codon:yes stop_codon:yes gene_type:complete